MASLLEEVPAARLFEEVLKLFLGGAALDTFEKLRHYNLFGQLFPATEEALAYEDHEFPIMFVNRGLANTDDRLQAQKPVTPAFLFAVLLWEPVRRRAEAYAAKGLLFQPGDPGGKSRGARRTGPAGVDSQALQLSHARHLAYAAAF